jgi:hypothetical protein
MSTRFQPSQTNKEFITCQLILQKVGFIELLPLALKSDNASILYLSSKSGRDKL